jgi:hypothetical protein
MGNLVMSMKTDGTPGPRPTVTGRKPWSHWHLACVIVAAGLISLPLQAQDDKPLVVGPFENSGSVTFGYRFTDLSGYRPEYQQMFDLESGPRLLDFSLFGHVADGKHSFMDDYSVVASGIGGEPWSTVQVNVRKKKRYDLRINLQQSHYYWNQNDGAALPGGIPGLTSNHDWATVRRIGNVNLLVHATSNLRFTFEYSHNARHGVNDTTRTMDYFGAPPEFSSYVRGNPYYLVGLINETSNRAAVGVDYTLKAFTFHYKVGVERMVDSFNGVNPYAGEVSIDTSDPLALATQETLTSATWADYRKLTTPVSEFSYNGKIFSKLHARGSYIFHSYTGPATLAMAASGLAGSVAASTITPYSFSETSSSNLTETSQVADQAFTLDVNNWLSMQADYRYTRFDVNANANFASVESGVTNVFASPYAVSGTDLNQWRIGTSTFDYDVIVTPMSSLLVQAGVRYLKSDIEATDNHAIDLLETKRIKTVWPTLSLSYKPNQVVSFRAAIDEVNNGSSYTQLMPHTDVRSHATARIRPLDKFWIENTFSTQDSKLDTIDFHTRVRANSTTASYELTDKVSGFVGFSYDSFWAQSFVNFLPGLSLIKQVSLTDQNVDRLWQGGINAGPVKHISVSFAGNYVRVNGQGIVLGSTPLYGPMTFPYASGSVSYDAGKAGKLSIQLQRTYYIEQIVSGNNFGAKILLISWKRSF